MTKSMYQLSDLERYFPHFYVYLNQLGEFWETSTMQISIWEAWGGWSL